MKPNLSSSQVQNAGNVFWGVFAIACIRDFLEVALEGKFLIDHEEPLHSLKTYFLHFNSFYFLIYVSLSLILYFFALKKLRISECFKIGALAMTLIWVGPLFDYFVCGTFDMFYPPDPLDVVRNIHHLADPFYHYKGLSMGMRVEILLAGLGAVGFLYYKTRNLLSALLGGVSISLACLSIGLLIPFMTQWYEYGFHFGYHELSKSTLLHQGFVVHGTGSKIALVYILLSLILFALAYYLKSPKSFLVIVRNFRLTRTLHYLLLFAGGLAYVYYHHPFNDSDYLQTIWHHPIDLFGIFMAAVAIGLSFQSAVIFNDIYDYDIDVLSNPDRPLVTKMVSFAEYTLIAKLFLILALTISFCISEIFFYFVLLYNLLAFLYSAPPFRLRKFFLMSNLLLSTIFLVTFHAGAAVLFSEYKFSLIPSNITFVLLLSYALALVVKDSKDYEGDRHSHIQTLYTLFGKRVANILTVIFVCLATLLPPILLHLKQLLFWGILICLIFVILVTFVKIKRQKEALVVLLYYVYVLSLFNCMVLA